MSLGRALVVVFPLLVVISPGLASPAYACCLPIGTCFTINSLGDEPDGDLNDGACDIYSLADHENDLNLQPACTLRAALQQANLVPETEGFGINKVQICSTYDSGEPVIALGSPLPPIQRSIVLRGRGLGIDGWPILDGAAMAGTANGLTINGGANLIEGWQIRKFQYGVLIAGGTNHEFRGNFLHSNLWGLRILRSNNFVGGSDAGEGNIISGNSAGGIRIEGSLSSGNFIRNNRIGLALNGSPLPNGGPGISILNSGGNTIGGAEPGEGNTLSANLGHGIEIKGANSNQNIIQGNRIGTNAQGHGDLGNNGDGVHIVDSPNTQLGGTGPSAGNIISGNNQNGVYLQGSTATGGPILGNFIGTDVSGTEAIPNQENGISMNQVGELTIGGTEPGSRNLISSNGKNGILIQGAKASGHRIQGNAIGTDLAGDTALGNGEDGIRLAKILEDSIGPNSNLIGGGSESERNLISGNGKNGIRLEGSGISDNRIEGNFIGTDAAGMAAVGNGENGVRITGGYGELPNFKNSVGGIEGTTLGGACTGDCNLISGNTGGGIQIDGIDVTLNRIEGNFIGTDLMGKAPIPNGIGVQLSGAHTNTVGGFPENADDPNPKRNLISGNAGFGLSIQGALGKSNQIFGNLIGTDTTGEAALGNGGGVEVRFNSGNRIGWNIPKAGNVIAANRGPGIQVTESHNTLIQGNLIGLTETGKALGNSGHGVYIQVASTANTIGGELSGMGNHIAYNEGDGVMISALHNNEILGNAIHDNLKMGIDLEPVGKNSNDPGDADLGANLLQNYPVLTAVFPGSEGMVVEGWLEGLPNSAYRIEIFSNLNCDPSENGEGEKFLAAYLVDTDDQGEAVFSMTVPFSDGAYFTATATDSGKNTSEFSPCRLQGVGGTDFDQDGIFDHMDNCPKYPNPQQIDSDHDQRGDPCDVCPGYPDNLDRDGDGLPDCVGLALVGQGCGLGGGWKERGGNAGENFIGGGLAWLLLLKRRRREEIFGRGKN